MKRAEDMLNEILSKINKQEKVARNIINCKTGAYGANVCVCEDCGFVQIHYNSCRNRLPSPCPQPWFRV